MRCNKYYNERNIETFKEYGTRYSSAYIFNCVICEHACCIENSISMQGQYMICNKCATKHFGHPVDAMKKIEELCYGSTKSEEEA